MRVASIVAVVLSFLVIQLGAYTRLTDAGLGCPDWPGCYGLLSVPQGEQIDVANEAFPERQVEPQKAWNEMIHRYLAGALGLLIVGLAIGGWRHSRFVRGLTVGLVALVIFQALLGMWTVTMKLNPLVVLAHLLGGFSIFALLCLLSARLRQASKRAHQTTSLAPAGAKRTLLVALIVVMLQVLLGGWTSANYAATACVELPVCESGWSERLDLKGAFSLPETTDGSYEYGRHNYQQRMTIHVFHRFGAAVVIIVVGLAIFQLVKARRIGASIWLSLLLVGQVSLGLINVIAHLPIAVAVAHNGGAALLFATLVVLWARRSKPLIFGGQANG
ncbi:COX15/CtaA family protein [Neiella sp. HB171785]|uniref:COX15/CtaA family protein n=1 Tax=Neiella litorisoli TaxID=2771431 RepID=A0A8J6QUY0_9GAMM|nr:COX15/CtaA family protein [Neiella litorisoli]MBD1391129.1 COX15/CtaA family protein [Neiella litorisoli]